MPPIVPSTEPPSLVVDPLLPVVDPVLPELDPLLPAVDPPVSPGTTVPPHAVALAIGRILPMVIVIAIVLVAGFTIAWRERRGTRRINQLTAPLALVAGSAIFMASASTARSNFGAEYATQSRYVYLAAAMTLPLFAIAVDALVVHGDRAERRMNRQVMTELSR